MGRQDEIRRLWRALATAYYSNLLGYNYVQISPVFPAHHRFSIFDLGSIREWTDVCVRSGRLLSTANSRRSITHRPRRDIDRLRITRYDSSRSARLRVHILLHTLLPPPLSPEMIELRTRACLPTWKPRISVFSLQRIELDFFTCFTCLDLRFDRRIYIYSSVEWIPLDREYETGDK